MSYTIAAYIVYLLVTVLVILRVGHILYKAGRPFVIKCMHGDVALADAINKMLLVGYYLFNTGYTVFVLRIWKAISSGRELAEALGEKIGLILLALGVMHMFNVIMLLVSDRRRTNRELRSIESTHQC